MSELLFAAFVTIVGLALVAFWRTAVLVRRLGPWRAEATVVGLGACLILVAVSIQADFEASKACAALRSGLTDVAPLFARRAERLQHWKVPTDARPDDPRLVRIIEAEKRWMSENPTASSVYTVRRQASGSYVFVAAAEADLDEDGLIKGDRELRIPAGEEYDESPPEFEQAFRTGQGFSPKPEQDDWGVWVTATQALHAPDGSVEAILCIDFSGAQWTIVQDRARLPVLLGGALVIGLFLSVWSVLVRLRLDRMKTEGRSEEILAEEAVLDGFANEAGKWTGPEAAPRDAA